MIHFKNSRYLKLFVLLFCFQCATLIPADRRVYPKNPIHLPEGIDLHDWMEKKRNQFPDRLVRNGTGNHLYKITYFRKDPLKNGSYISCGAVIRMQPPKTIVITDLVFLVNYGDYTKSSRRHVGDLGPLTEKEREEILLPCIEEFLESDSKN